MGPPRAYTAGHGKPRVWQKLVWFPYPPPLEKTKVSLLQPQASGTSTFLASLGTDSSYVHMTANTWHPLTCLCAPCPLAVHSGGACRTHEDMWKAASSSHCVLGHFSSGELPLQESTCQAPHNHVSYPGLYYKCQGPQCSKK